MGLATNRFAKSYGYAHFEVIDGSDRSIFLGWGEDSSEGAFGDADVRVGEVKAVLLNIV